MGDRSAEMLNIMIAIIAVVALMALGFAIFTISKRMANSSQNDLVNQLDSISKSMYTDLDQQIITGARLKQVVNQASTTDCAIIVSTLGFLGAQAGLGEAVAYADNNGTAITTGAKPEATLNGDVSTGMIDAATPILQLENMPMRTTLNNIIGLPLAVNFGSVLKNSITEAPDAEGNFESMVDSSDGTAANIAFNDTAVVSGEEIANGSKATKFDGTTEYAQTIKYEDGQFITKLEFATDTSSRIVRYDRTSDFTKTGKTYTVSDTAQFNSYVLKNTAGDYMGLVFCQRNK